MVLLCAFFAHMFYPIAKALLRTDSYNEPMTVEFIQSQNGTSALIVVDDFSMLVNAGNKSNYKNIVKTMDKYGIQKLDHLVVTCNDTTYNGSANKIIKKYQPKNILAGQGVKKLKTDVEVKYPIAEYMFTHNALKVTVVAANDDENAAKKEDLPLVLRLDYKNDSFLISNKATVKELNYNIEHTAKSFTFKNCDVISANSVWLSSYNAKYYIISDGKDFILDNIKDQKNAKPLFAQEKNHIFITYGNGIKYQE